MNDPSTPPVAEANESLKLLEENARVEKQQVETGRIRIRSRTEAIEDVVRDTLTHEAVEVTRVPVNRTIAEGEPLPQTKTEGNLTVVPVFEEILVVEKRLVLKEELHIQRRTTHEDVALPVTLRKQRAEIDRSDDPSLPADMKE